MYMGNTVSERNVSGFILSVFSVPTSWQSRAQRSVILSALDTEWVVLSETVKDVMIVIQLLGSIQISVKLLVMVRVDNVGATFMASYVTTTSLVKPVDIK